MHRIAELVKKVQPGNGIIAPPPFPTKAINPVSIRDLDTGHHPLIKEAVEVAYEWVERKKSHPNASLVLVASPVTDSSGAPDINRTGYGVGKTHIAKAVMWSKKIVDDYGAVVGHSGQFYLARDLLGRLREETPRELAPGGVSFPDGASYSYSAVGTHAVVIDDVGTEGILPYIRTDEETQRREMQARYFDFINYCYGGTDSFGNKTGISLVITANMTLDQLARHLGGRCWSRLLEMAPAGFMVDMTGVPDYRRQVSGR